MDITRCPVIETARRKAAFQADAQPHDDVRALDRSVATLSGIVRIDIKNIARSNLCRHRGKKMIGGRHGVLTVRLS